MLDLLLLLNYLHLLRRLPIPMVLVLTKLWLHQRPQRRRLTKLSLWIPLLSMNQKQPPVQLRLLKGRGSVKRIRTQQAAPQRVLFFLIISAARTVFLGLLLVDLRQSNRHSPYKQLADRESSFGASLSYASADGKSGAKSAQTLADVMTDDDVEVVIMSNRSCDDGTCGFVRPGGVNYRECFPFPKSH